MGPLRLLAWGPVKHKVQMHFGLRGAFHLPELTGQALPVVMRISLLIKTTQPDQILKSMKEGDGFSSKTLGKTYFIFKMTGQATVRPVSSDFRKGLVPRYNSRVRCSLGPNVNAPFLQEPTLAGARETMYTVTQRVPKVWTHHHFMTVAALVPGHQAEWTAP